MFLPSNITLKFGDSGDFVSELQRRLTAVHHFSADAISGFFDGTTVNGVSSFQSASGIRADGIAGPETLRRLNGVISGDSSATESSAKAEEEARAQQAQANHLLQQQQLLYEQQALLAQEQALLAQQQQQQQQQAAPAPEPYAVPAPQAQPQAALPEVNYAPAPAYQPPQPARQPLNDDTLAQMLLTQPPQQQLTPAPQQAQMPVPHQAQAPHQPMPQTPPQPPIPPQPHQTPYPPVASPSSEANQQLAPTAEPPPRGIVGRAMQYANEIVQKLANYFENKLPDHVLSEVRTIGMVMARSGVQEASIPTGPAPAREIEGPQRGQQQGQQRG
ncbi:MAG: peptidoglycan-binding domain-containing protein [Alphaproteobacteria bacterium]|nr:peptidoglycan-binding domain-containing protein [Alphaproteobacteria bacterium]